MKPSGIGGRNSVKPLPTNSAAGAPGPAIHGIWARHLTIHKQRHSLWRAVDQDGNVLDILVQRRRNRAAAKKFFRKLLKGFTSVPRVIVTDKLKSYGAATREILPSVEHRQHRYLNNRKATSGPGCGWPCVPG
jgi:hypothetical protein